MKAPRRREAPRTPAAVSSGAATATASPSCGCDPWSVTCGGHRGLESATADRCHVDEVVTTSIADDEMLTECPSVLFLPETQKAPCEDREHQIPVHEAEGRPVARGHALRRRRVR